MKSIDFKSVQLNNGFWFEKEKLNREKTINAVYNRFADTGRIKAFDFDWRDGEDGKPHIFWDSDVAKWMEGAAYILAKHSDKELEEKLDSLIEKIRENQGKDGYFNIYFTVVEPAKRFKDRNCHELYCAGHLIEAAIACDEIGKPQLLYCMEKYVDYIIKVFLDEKSASFASPGHEEIELALVRLYKYTLNKKYLSLAEHFINIRGSKDDFTAEAGGMVFSGDYCQSHKPVREQDEAVGHAVRALYLYTGMAMLAKETDDTELFNVCKKLFENITTKKMYVTGGVGSTHIGEAFTNAYDLPNDVAYAETCAAISMMFFGKAMLENENDGKYADVIERAFYNGVLSGLSLDGKSFFYTNPLEINLNEHSENLLGKAWFPITRRPEIFDCSCCPPNINRVLASLGGYVFGMDNGTLFINQYTASEMKCGDMVCKTVTEYPLNGKITVTATGCKKIALRIPEWCENFELNKPFDLKKGYAIIENDGDEIILNLEMRPRAVFADSHILRDAYKLCVMRGPVVYCAESIDNIAELHRFSLSPNFKYEETLSDLSALPEINISAYCLENCDEIYSSKVPKLTEKTLHMIPYNAFANREECDMRIWFSAFNICGQ